MKTSSRLLSVASLVVGIANATATPANAQGMQGGMGPGMMQRDRAPGAASSAIRGSETWKAVLP